MNTSEQTRRVAAIDRSGRGILIQEPVPTPEVGQVLVKVHAASISPGSELLAAKQLRSGETLDLSLPRRFGYQNSGVIEAVGEGVVQFEPGQRVACFGGHYAYISDWAVVPQNLCCVMPDAVSYEDAAFGNVMLTALHAVRRADARLGENMLIVGAGLVGQLSAQFVRMAGMNVMVWDTLEQRLAIARQCGAHASVNVKEQDAKTASRAFTQGQGFDAAIMAIGGDGSQAFQDALSVMMVSPDGHQMGRIVLVGGLHVTLQGGDGVGNVDVRGSARTGPGYHDSEWEHGRASYPPVFIRWNTQTNLAWTLKQIERGDLRISPLITQRYPLDRLPEAVEVLVESPGKALGVVLSDQPGSQ